MKGVAAGWQVLEPLYNKDVTRPGVERKLYDVAKALGGIEGLAQDAQVVVTVGGVQDESGGEQLRGQVVVKAVGTAFRSCQTSSKTAVAGAPAC